jgi:hypothetical protein
MTAIILSAPFAPRGLGYAAVSTSFIGMQSAGLVQFTVPAGLAYTVGLRLRAYAVASGGWMEGLVNDYTGTTLTLEITSSYGSGFHNEWNINLAGEPGVFPPLPGVVSNALITETRNAGIATFSLKTLSSSDPSAVNPLQILFNDGSNILVSNILMVNVGVALDTVNNTPFRLWIVLFNDAGTARLGVLQSRATDNSIRGFPPNGILPVALFGTAAGSIYANSTPAAPVPFIILACADYDNGQPTAGNWSNAPTRIVMFSPGMKLPGQVLQDRGTFSGEKVYASVQIPVDDTIPQQSEGVLFLSQSIIPFNKASVFEIEAQAIMQPTGGADNYAMSITRDDQSNCIAANWSYNSEMGIMILARSLANTVATFSFGLRFGSNSGVPFTLNGASNARYFGGAFNSFIKVKELAT